jgi:hypothetical protein
MGDKLLDTNDLVPCACGCKTINIERLAESIIHISCANKDCHRFTMTGRWEHVVKYWNEYVAT